MINQNREKNFSNLYLALISQQQRFIKGGACYMHNQIIVNNTFSRNKNTVLNRYRVTKLNPISRLTLFTMHSKKKIHFPG